MSGRIDFGFLGISNLQMPDLVEKFDGRLVICGGAACVWDDLQKLGIRGDSQNNGYDVMCVNDIVMHFPGRVLHAFSNDAKMFEFWLGARRKQIVRAFGPVEYVHTCNNRHAKYSWPWPGNGTSALGAVHTGLAMGYRKIVLCGIPLDDGPHYFSPPWGLSNFTREVPQRDGGQMAYWFKVSRQWQGRVTSMSGRTKELLGAP